LDIDTARVAFVHALLGRPAITFNRPKKLFVHQHVRLSLCKMFQRNPSAVAVLFAQIRPMLIL
jgi:hypothetical protein